MTDASPPEPTWISPTGRPSFDAVPDATASERVAEGWIGLSRADGVLSVAVREGAVDARAVRTLIDATKPGDPASTVLCTRGDGTLRSVRHEMQRTCWHGETYGKPEDELASIRRAIAIDAVDAAHGAWLRQGLASGEPADQGRVAEAARALRTAARDVLDVASRVPRDVAASADPDGAGRTATAWLDRIDVLQNAMEARWVELAGAVCASEGEPGKAVDPAEESADAFLAIRRLRTLRAGMEKNSFLDIRTAFPDSRPALDALDALRVCTRLPTRHLAKARETAASGLSPVSLGQDLSFRVCHEASRSYQAIDWRVREVLNLAETVPASPAP
jgi:hypothetical protein